MSDRVLATQEGVQALRRMRDIINGPLLEQINSLNQQGQLLSQPNVWDGQLASRFRSQWPDMDRALKTLQQQLEELRQQSEQINQNILRAGGN